MSQNFLCRVNESEEVAELLIYDAIGGFDGISAKEVVRSLASLPEKPISVRINSGGGEVFEGLAIFEALNRREGVTVHVDGLAASMASVIAMAGDEIVMGQGAFLMIHNPWSVALGDADEMRKQADTLDKIKASLVGIYASRTGIDPEEVEKMMDEETWLSATEAKELGFVTAVEGEEVNALAFAAMQLGSLKSAPKALLDQVAEGRAKEVAGLKTTITEREQAFAALSEKAEALALANAEFSSQIASMSAAIEQAQARAEQAEQALAAQVERVNAEAARMIAAAGHPPVAVVSEEEADRNAAQSAAKLWAQYRDLPLEQRAEFYRKHRQILKDN